MAALKKIISWFWPVRVKNSAGKISPVLEVTFEQGKKVLNAGEVNYSYGALHRVFRIALKKAEVEKQQPKAVLILGFGAGSIASILAEEYHLNCEITGIEADEEVIRLAKEEFDVSRFAHLQLLHAKAEEFVVQTTHKFDLIAVDVFVESKIPEACRRPEFLQALYNLLNANGRVVYNEMPAGTFSDNDVMSSRFKAVFEKTEIHQITIGGAPNRVFIAFREKED